MDHSAVRRVVRASLASALALFGVATLGCGERTQHPRAPANVVLITLDTTRPDHLGLYGHTRPTSPTLDMLGSESQVFDNAYSTSSWTLPAHASLFTGMLPTSHGGDKDPEGALVLSAEIEAPETWKIYRANAPRTDVPTLAEVLKGAGYATGAVVGGPWMKRVFGLGRGFDFYDDENIVADGRPANELTERARAWLRERKTPFFLFLNYFDPHTPYTAPDTYAKQVLGGATFSKNAPQDEIRLLLYDAEIRFTDDQISLLFLELHRLGLYDSSWIIVTADHGELFGEHERYGHGITLDQEVVRVPLIVKPPLGVATPGRRKEWVQLTDVMALVLDALGLPTPPSSQGSVPGKRSDPILAEVRLLPAESDEAGYRAIIEDGWKLIASSRGENALFDLEQDPRESHDLSEIETERTARMIAQLEHLFAKLPRPPPPGPAPTLDPETIDALRGLGYVQ